MAAENTLILLAAAGILAFMVAQVLRRSRTRRREDPDSLRWPATEPKR